MSAQSSPLNARDKAAIQRVTRHSDLQWAQKFEFSVSSGTRITFNRPGTTAFAGFPIHSENLQDYQRYIADLAVFAYRRLARKHGTAARSMLYPQVVIHDKRWSGCRFPLWELVEEHTGYTREEIEREVIE